MVFLAVVWLLHSPNLTSITLFTASALALVCVCGQGTLASVSSAFFILGKRSMPPQNVYVRAHLCVVPIFTIQFFTIKLCVPPGVTQKGELWTTLVCVYVYVPAAKSIYFFSVNVCKPAACVLKLSVGYADTLHMSPPLWETGTHLKCTVDSDDARCSIRHPQKTYARTLMTIRQCTTAVTLRHQEDKKTSTYNKRQVCVQMFKFILI